MKNQPRLHEIPHFKTEDVFRDPVKLVRGFTEKDYSAGMHSQGFYEINIVLRGEATHYVGQRALTVRKGDTFIIPPNVMHGYDGGVGFDVYHILLSPKYLEKNGADLQILPGFSSLFRIEPMVRAINLSKLHFRLSEAEMDALIPRLEALTDYTKRTGIPSAIIANCEALAVIAQLCTIYNEHVLNGMVDAESDEDRSFLESISYIHENISGKLTIEALCRIAKMSRTAYIEKFKKTTDYPPAKYIRRLRVDMAKMMLLDETLTEHGVALAVGCTDTSHLIKLFSAETGQSPSQFRHENHL